MKKSRLVVFLFLNSAFVFGQWTTKAPFTGAGRNHPVTFTLNGFGYAITGYNTSASVVYGDAYKYDPQNNSWSQLADFPGAVRGFAVGASHNGKGYLGFGLNSANQYLKDLWEYDPTTDTWKRLPDCPCLARKHPAFTITSDGKIYVGLGDGRDNMGQFISGFADWWEYDITTSTWSQKTNLPSGGRHHPYYFSIGTDVFVGFGHSGTTIYSDFYKFNSTNGQWTTLNNFPGEARVAGAQFTHNGLGYIVDGDGSDHQNLDDGEFYQYNPITNTWKQLSSHSGDGLWAPGAFVIDDIAYVVGGDKDNDQSLTTLWAYSLKDAPVDNALTNTNGTFTLSNSFFDENASFQWIDCTNDNLPLAGETSSTVTIPEEASYALITNYSEGGSDTSDCYTSKSVLTSINDRNKNLSYSIFPNPSKDRIYLNYNYVSEKAVSYQILDRVGREVKQGRLTNPEYSGIEIKSLTSGMYFLLISSQDNGIKEVIKFEKVN